MPILNCTVGNCDYNKDNLCCLDSIKVEGDNAKVSNDTACGSFKERSRDSYTSAVETCGCPTSTSDIDCKAVHCNYNDECKCRAGHIQVSGPNSHECCDTECSTFTDK